MNSHYFLQSAAGISKSGIYTLHNGHTPWLSTQKSPSDILREQVFDMPMPEFGKLQLTEKLAFSAAALTFQSSPDIDRSSLGICLGTALGSLSTDIKYMKSVASGFPSPALFSATLPSSPVAEIAIRFHITGPNRVITDGIHPAISSLDQALSMQRHKKALAMLAVSVNAPNETIAESGFEIQNKDSGIYCFAFLMTSSLVPGARNIRMTTHGCLNNSGILSEAEDSYLTDMLYSCRDTDFKNTGFSINGISFCLEKN